MRQISQAGLDLIKEFEGLELTSYQDQAGVWTIGWGCTVGVTEGMTITEDQATQMLLAELATFETGVPKWVTVELNDNQFDALVSFSYNLGLGSLEESTLLKLLNTGDYAGAANQFPVWDKVRIDGMLTADPGLLRRRLAEQALFLTPIPVV